MINPLTGREIQAGGATHMELLRRGIYPSTQQHGGVFGFGKKSKAKFISGPTGVKRGQLKLSMTPMQALILVSQNETDINNLSKEIKKGQQRISEIATKMEAEGPDLALINEAIETNKRNEVNIKKLGKLYEDLKVLLQFTA